MSKDTADRAALARACTLVRPALAAQPYVKALTYIAFDGERATAYDDKAAISVKCEMPLKRLVPGVLLVQALGSFGGGEVLCRESDDGHLVLSSGRAKVKLPTLDYKDWPLEFPQDEADRLDVTDEMVAGIGKCLLSVNSDANHPSQMGVTLDCDDEGRLVLYSTDNRSVSRFTTKSKVKLPGDAPVIMPTFFCEQLVGLRKAFPKEECRLLLRAESVMALFGDEATLFSRLPVDLTPEDFPAIYKRFIGDNTKLSPIPDSFDAALGRALMVLGGEAVKKSVLEVGRGAVRIVSTCDAGEADDVCEGKVVGHDDPVEVSAQHLARGAKATTHMTVTRKVTVFGDERGQFLHLVAHLA